VSSAESEERASGSNVVPVVVGICDTVTSAEVHVLAFVY